jgi:hypothetical protein
VEPRRVAIDSVIGTQDFFGGTEDWPTQYVFDTFMSAEIHPRWQVSFRPKLWRTRGDWHPLVDQLSIETGFRKGSNWRIEAGRFPSPIGLGMTENRADLNAGVIWWHRAYYMPIPSIGEGQPRVSLVSAVYPEGAQVSTSADHWDARAALVDKAPVAFWRAQPGASRSPNGIVGAGLRPKQGLRIGAATAWGAFADATSSAPAEVYRMLNVEGEYAFGYTKISGEWTHDTFATAGGDRISTGCTIQAQQTLTPRLFAHSRVSLMRSPEVSRADPAMATPRDFRSIDTTLGYRVSPEVTLRLGHSAVRSWSDTHVDQQVGVSLMWTTRWW